jgi:hypothetical protein
VELMIAYPLTLPDQPLSLDALEGAIQEWGQTIKQRALALAWAAQATQAPVAPCPDCQSREQQRAGHKARKVETVFGSVQLPRQRYRCMACGRHFQPDDALLTPLLGVGRCTPRVRELAATCGASWPYQQAAVVIGKVRGTPLAAETVRRIVAETGRAVATQYRTQARRACQPPATAPPATPTPAQVDVVLDGAWIHSRENAHGLEVKVGVVHTGSAACGATRTRLPTRCYAATAWGIIPFGPLVTAAIDHLDGFAAVEQTLLGDGAGWIWRLGASILPDATAVLDRWHLRDARRRATRAAIPDKEERASWSVRIEEAVEAGAVEAARAVLAEMAVRYPHPALGEFATYLHNQATRIPDYAARRAAGQTIGSGVGEKGVDLVVNRRLKGRRGMRWLRARADGVVALRLALLNDEWDDRMAAALAA